MGCKVRAHALVKPPFVVDVHSSNRPGIEPQVLALASKLLNFTVEYVPDDFKLWGLKLTDGTYTEMVGNLYQGDVDLVFGNFRTNDSFMDDFSVSIPYVPTKISIFVPAAQKLSNWNSIVFVFAPIVWLLVCLATVAIVATTIFVSKRLSSNEGYASLVFATLQFYGVLLGKSVRQPEAPFLRTVFMVWTVASFVLSSSYENTFLSFLVKPLYDQQINTVKEILASNLQVGGSRYSMKFFETVAGPKFTTEWVDCHADLSCVERTSTLRDLATIENEFFIRYYLRSFLDRRGRLTLHVCDESIVYYSWVLLRKGFPLQIPLNKLIEALRDNGLIAKWTDTYLRQVYTEDLLRKSPLLLDNLLLIFYIYCGGVLIAFLTFLCERYYYG